MMDNILEILVCPMTKGRLEYDNQQQLLISRQAKLAFPIIENVPNMQVETALDLDSLDLQNDKQSLTELSLRLNQSDTEKDNSE